MNNTYVLRCSYTSAMPALQLQIAMKIEFGGTTISKIEVCSVLLLIFLTFLWKQFIYITLTANYTILSLPSGSQI